MFGSLVKSATGSRPALLSCVVLLHVGSMPHRKMTVYLMLWCVAVCLILFSWTFVKMFPFLVPCCLATQDKVRTESYRDFAYLNPAVFKDKVSWPRPETRPSDSLPPQIATDS